MKSLFSGEKYHPNLSSAEFASRVVKVILAFMLHLCVLRNTLFCPLRTK